MFQNVSANNFAYEKVSYEYALTVIIKLHRLPYNYKSFYLKNETNRKRKISFARFTVKVYTIYNTYICVNLEILFVLIIFWVNSLVSYDKRIESLY